MAGPRRVSASYRRTGGRPGAALPGARGQLVPGRRLLADGAPRGRPGVLGGEAEGGGSSGGGQQGRAHEPQVGAGGAAGGGHGGCGSLWAPALLLGVARGSAPYKALGSPAAPPPGWAARQRSRGRGGGAAGGVVGRAQGRGGGASRGRGGEHSRAVAWTSPPGERLGPMAGSSTPPPTPRPRALPGTSVSWGAGVTPLPALDSRPVDSPFPAGSWAPRSPWPGTPFLLSAL